MIEGRCVTNLDKFRRAEWPELFVTLPRVGDYVQARGGQRLKVYSVTHVMFKNTLTHDGERPGVEIELHN